MKPFDTRQIRKIIDDVEATLLEVEQCKVALHLLAVEVENRAFRLATLTVADELDSTLRRMRTACHELRTAHHRLPS